MTKMLLRRPEVEQRCGLSKASIYREMRAGRFPLPVKVSPQSVRWHEGEIADWVESRPRAEGDAAHHH